MYMGLTLWESGIDAQPKFTKMPEIGFVCMGEGVRHSL
jgi:hypothetical protein